MGSITLTAVGDVSVGTKTKTYTVSDADMNRFVAALKAKATTAAIPAPTVTQALVAWADNVIANAKTDTLSYEQGISAAAISSIAAT